jgi:hypothetical protein
VELLASFAWQPGWLVGAVVGAVIGAVSALLFKWWKLDTKFVMVPTVIAIVLTFSTFVPALREGDAGKCVFARAAADLANENDVGTMLDEFTEYTRMDVDCNAKTIVHRLSLNLGVLDLSDEAWAAVQTNLNADVCSNDETRPFIDQGWAIIYTYTSSIDGGGRSIAVRCA